MRMCASSAFPGKTAPDGAVLSGQALLFTDFRKKKNSSFICE